MKNKLKENDHNSLTSKVY